MTQSRRMLVLRAVVEDYIRSQEPVGSTSLTRDHDLGVSRPPSVTIWPLWRTKAI